MAKANARAKLILKAFLCHDIQSLKHAFITFVCPILKYVTIEWCSYFKSGNNIIENFQRSFTHTLFYLCNFAPTNYDNKFKCFGLQCLKLCRIIHNLCFMFNLTHGLTGCSLYYAKRYALNVGTIGHCFKLYVVHARKIILSMHFMHCIVPVWNFLRDQCFLPDTYNVFRARFVKLILVGSYCM